MSEKRVKVRVPATTANLGPGFDCLGVALTLYNQVWIEPMEARKVVGFLADVFDGFYAASGVSREYFRVHVEGDVPTSRGLGSSVTVRMGVLYALNEWFDRPLTPQQVCDLTVDLEGHPDNAVPAFRGGFCCCSEDEVIRAEVVPELKFITVIPNFKMNTEESRLSLPKEVSVKDAVQNLQNTGVITGAFCLKEYERLRGAFGDHFHQPYRGKLIPGFFDALEVAKGAGALGAYLSGSGSTIMAVGLENEEEIAAAMKDVLTKAGHEEVTIHVLEADNEGAKVERGD